MIRVILEAYSQLHRVGAQVGNPLQCYRSAVEGTTVLRAALAVVEHNRPGFESHRQQLHSEKGMQFRVSLHPMNEYIFVLRSRQIFLRTNSYADPK